MPVSGSTSTSTMCAPKALVEPAGATEARPTTGSRPVLGDLRRQFLERERLAVVAVRAVLDRDRGRVAFPEDRGARSHLVLKVLAQLVGRQAGGERDAAAAGQERVADRIGVGDLRPDVLGADAQGLGELHGDAGAACRRCRWSPRPG